MKFDIKDLKWGGIILFEKSDDDLIDLGDISLSKENKKKESFCNQDEDYFDYFIIKKALCGKTNTWRNDGTNFTPKRILVIQMK